MSDEDADAPPDPRSIAAEEFEAAVEGVPEELVAATNAGGFTLYVPDASSAPPEGVIVEGDTAVSFGADVPADGDDESQIPGRVAKADHHVGFRVDTLPDGTERIRDGGTVHAERKSPNDDKFAPELVRKLADRAGEEGLDLRVDHRYGSSPLTHANPTEASPHRLGTRVRLLNEADGLLGVGYRVPSRGPDPAEVVVVADTDRALRSLRKDWREPLADFDPDVLVAPRAKGANEAGNLLDEFSPTAFVATTRTVKKETRELADETGTYLARAGTDVETVIDLTERGVGSNSLPDSTGLTRATDHTAGGRGDPDGRSAFGGR